MNTSKEQPVTTLRFFAGTLEVRGGSGCKAVLPKACVFDRRSACFRAPAIAYADVVKALVRAKHAFVDDAKGYYELDFGLRAHFEPRPYQQGALDAWRGGRSQGVVVLPTGAGKSLVGVLAIAEKRRSTLVVVPTLDLVRQWHDLLATMFGVRIGLVGGGEYELQPITVTTYDSAHIHMENFGARFGLIIYDECHHLPGPAYATSAQMALAPFRLGLTATPERADGMETLLDTLIGPILYRQEIDVMRGEYLADYETHRITVDLDDDDRATYDAERAIYRDFVASQGIRMGSARGWSEFIMRSAGSDEGRRALLAYRRQRALAEGAPAKFEVCAALLHQHRHERTIVFTQNNSTAYALSRRFLIPIITHQTKVRERSEILAQFKDGTYSALVTSKVLNEGVDVPDASVAVVVSGSGSVREHVQRLGRILRKSGDKRAKLYELVTRETGETFTSERRRKHVAYK